MTATLTLTDFLLARIAEDESVARAASTGRVWTWDDRGEDLLSEHTYAIGKMTGRECIIATEGANPPNPETTGAHIARHDPARVLARCEVDRRIVEDVETDARIAAKDIGRHVLRLLALSYADHPDYRQEWKP